MSKKNLESDTPIPKRNKNEFLQDGGLVSQSGTVRAINNLTPPQESFITSLLSQGYRAAYVAKKFRDKFKAHLNRFEVAAFLQLDLF